MADYRQMYLGLFRGVTQAIELLQRAQQESEEVFMLGREPELTVIPPQEEE